MHIYTERERLKQVWSGINIWDIWVKVSGILYISVNLKLFVNKKFLKIEII